jgi:hypothetical protein
MLEAVRDGVAQSALGQAVAYTLHMWEKLRRCFDYADHHLFCLVASDTALSDIGSGFWPASARIQAKRCPIKAPL